MDRIAGYVRVSTESQAEDDSHIRQRETIEEYVESDLDGDPGIVWFEDIAESGQNLSRDEYEELMDRLHEFDAVIVRELSRFGRSLQKLLNDLEILQDHDVDFISIKDDHIDTSSAQGKLLLNIMGAFNQFWSDLARERQYEVIERKKAEGKSWGRDRILSDEQILHLHDQHQQHNYSYETLAVLAEANGWADSISRQTIYRYMKAVDQGEIEA